MQNKKTIIVNILQIKHTTNHHHLTEGFKIDAETQICETLSTRWRSNGKWYMTIRFKL